MGLIQKIQQDHERRYGAWKVIPEFPMYEAATHGDYIRNRRTGKMMSVRPWGNGRLKVALMLDGKQYYCYIHRLTWMAHVGPIPDGHHIDHINRVWDDNDLMNLRKLTEKEHAAFTKLTKKARLTDAKVRAIRVLHWKYGVPTVEISRRMNIPDAQIKRIIDYKAYANVASNDGPIPSRRKLWGILKAGTN